MPDTKRSELEITQELFEFLQGNVPDGYLISPDDVPKLPENHAWTVLWFIQNQYHQYRDTIYRCDVCKELYDANEGGDCLDFGSPPYFFCEECVFSDKYEGKLQTKPWCRYG